MRFSKFKVGGIFTPLQIKKYASKPTSIGTVPFISCQTTHNGIAMYCGETPEVENCITVSTNGNCFDCFYHPYPIIPSSDVEVLYKKGITDDEYIALYLCAAMSPNSKLFSYSNKPKNGKVFSAEISLPVVESSDPAHVYTPDDIDWEYMRERIAELERERIAELDAYLKATGLDDYELTDEDKYILSLSPTTIPSEAGTVRTDSEDGDERFGEFKVGELFEILNNPQLDKCNFAFGHGVGYEYPYFTRTENNNGILGYVKYLDEEHKLPGGSLAVGMISMRFHYMSHDFYAGQFTKTLVPKFGHMNDVVAQYFIALLNKHSAYYQSYLVREFSRRVADTVLALPITPTGEPDFDFMERYIRAVEKLTIAGVVQYKDRVIETTKGIVNGTAIETN